MRYGLTVLVFAGVLSLAGCASASGGSSDKPIHETLADDQFNVAIPDEWKSLLSSGPMTVVGPPFYGVLTHWGLWPVIRFRWPLRNLTAERLYVRVNYDTDSHDKKLGHTGFGVCYALAPGEERVIAGIALAASGRKGFTFKIRMYEPCRDGTPDWSLPTRSVAKADVPPASRPDSDETVIQTLPVANEHLTVEELRLAHSRDEGNVLLVKVRNKTEAGRALGIYVAVNDPRELEERESAISYDRGSFAESAATVPAKGEMTLRLPYTVPATGPNPLLVFVLFEPRADAADTDAHDVRRRDITLLTLGWAELARAAAAGDCVIPEFVPVEERAKLTAEKSSKHFIFRFRPGSCAEQEISTIIEERERAYDLLAHTLKMELTQPVQIDLYPDMKAKAFGSKTGWTPANTVSAFHIAEVYSGTYKCDPNHELAHCFSYRFPNHAALGQFAAGGGLLEAFAEYFERGSLPFRKEDVRRQLEEGKLPPLSALLTSPEPTRAHCALIDFLIKKDVEKFKAFYVRVTAKPTDADLHAASKEVYKLTLEEMEKDWHAYLESPAP